MKKMCPYEAAKKAFRKGELTELSVLQATLAEWQKRTFGETPLELMALGVCEEAGELAHCVGKYRQNSRGMKTRKAFEQKASDAVGDIVVYLMQLCTMLGVDFHTCVHRTAEYVMDRGKPK